MNVEEKYLAEWFPDEDENDFILNVRINGTWDEEHFNRMIDSANDWLDEMEIKSITDPTWDEPFINTINNLVNLLLHPGFLAENDLDMTRAEYEEYIREKTEKLNALKHRYISNKAKKIEL
jgi:hypothetical protein